MGECVGKQADQPDENQIDRDQIIQQARQDQHKDAEQEREQRLNHDDVNVHGFSDLSLRWLQRVNLVPGRMTVPAPCGALREILKIP
jgi:hypothetical protein